MAGSNQNKKSNRQNDRLGPSMAQGSSRVSKVVGGDSGKSVRVEQRSSSSLSKQGSRGQNQRAASGGKAGAKKGSSATPKKPAKASPSVNNGTADSRVIDKARNAWGDLEPHHQQRVLGILLLFLSLFLFAVLTIFSKVALFSAINGGFTFLFGWGVYPLSLGLIAFAVAHLVEGIQNRKLIRWSLVVGLVILWLIVLAESRLLLGGQTGGVLGSLLTRLLQGWPVAVGHILLIGLFVIVTIITFQITVGHVLAVAYAMGIGSSSRKNTSPDNTARPSPFLGQRPRFSRYANNATPLPVPPRGAAKPEDDEEEEDDEDIISFEPDFGEDDDPLNDINVLKQHVGNVPRGVRSVPPINVNEHSEAVQGVSQRALPFNQQAKQADKEKRYPTLEPLSPNPLRKNQPRAVNRVAAPALPVNESPWKVPDTTLLNNPEEVKLQLFGDDTTALAKTIQDTLRSFRVDAEVRPEDISIGPTIIRFGIRPTGKPELKQDAQGKYTPVRDAGGNIIYETRTRVSRIMALQNDLALVLEAKTIRMEAPVPGRPYVGVEIPNKNSRLVTLREVLESKEYLAAKAKSKLAIALGKDVAGLVRVGDLARMPHLLIAGATGAGKCLAYDEPVFLADGRVVKVQELVGQSAQVIGVTDTQTMRQTPVHATFTENGSQEVFEITLDNGTILRRTAEHPLWAAHLNENQHVGRQPDGKASRRTRAIDSGWVQSKDLQVCGNRPNFDGHVILCPLAIQQQGTVSRSDADVILCAALIAEGGLNQYDYLTYMRTPRFTNADPLMVELVAGAVKEYDCQLVLSQTKSKGPIDYYISKTTRKGRGSGIPVAVLVRDWGINCLATQKTIPSWVFQLPDEQIALFLRVFIDCDGWICARTQGTVSVNVTLANPILVQQIGQLALRLGIVGTYTYKSNGFAGAWSWYSSMVDLWQERVGSLVKAEKLTSAVKEQAKNRQFAATEWSAWRRARPTTVQTFADCPQGYEWRKIVSIRRVTAPTVNIEVHSDNHAFVGYAVEHNSVCINTIIASVLTQATPDDVRLLMVDPKMVELNMYAGIPHLLSPVVTEVDKVVPLLRNAITEMERRYRLFSQLGVRNLDGYRKLRAEKMLHGDDTLQNLPAIVIIIDELADLMMAAPEEVEGMICRLAQLARATGIHLVVATQRPSVDVITGLIKANIPTRISFMVSSSVDSRTIIDMGGAERLLGRGDMLYLPADAGRPERIQGSFLADEEAESLVLYWRQQFAQHLLAQRGDSVNGAGVPEVVELPQPVEPGWEIKENISDDFELDDDLLDKAEEVIREYGRASISLLQRRLRVGYSRAARLIDLLEERGIIGHSESGGRSREVLDGGSERNGNGGEGRTMADEVADIVADERAREDALKKQPGNGLRQLSQQQQINRGPGEEDEEL
nr:DNA translocase FtsK [Ktedonobacteraceae bacterium]